MNSFVTGSKEVVFEVIRNGMRYMTDKLVGDETEYSIYRLDRRVVENKKAPTPQDDAGASSEGQK